MSVARRAPDGFTLVEVLVALAITAVALLAGLKLVTATIDGLRESELRSHALRCADEQVVTARLDLAQSAQPADLRSVCEQAGQAFPMRVRVTQSPHLNFRRMEVTVFAPSAASGAVADADAARRQLVQRLVFLPVGF